jgi:hypothetical protein
LSVVPALITALSLLAKDWISSRKALEQERAKAKLELDRYQFTETHKRVTGALMELDEKLSLCVTAVVTYTDLIQVASTAITEDGKPKLRTDAADSIKALIASFAKNRLWLSGSVEGQIEKLVDDLRRKYMSILFEVEMMQEMHGAQSVDPSVTNIEKFQKEALPLLDKIRREIRSTLGLPLFESLSRVSPAVTLSANKGARPVTFTFGGPPKHD